MKVGIYIRVSTEEQVKEGYSISAQTKSLKAFCVSQGWDIGGMYIDEGVSAKDTNRPELERMINDIKTGELDCVLVYRLDRLTRSVYDLYKLLEVFERHDCSFKSATEVFDTTTSMGRMFITIVAALAQWERENTAERIRFGNLEKAKQGKYVHNQNLFGFKINKEDYRLEVIESEAKVVRKIFSLYQKGFGMNRIARYLNERHLFTSRGNNWSDNTISKVLRNETYAGVTTWDDVRVEDTHEAIVSPSTFKHVQDLIKRRASMHPRRLSRNYIFSGTLRCNYCKGALVGNFSMTKLKSGKTARYYQYRCRARDRGVCKEPTSLSEKQLEKAFLKYIGNYKFEKEIKEINIEAEENPVQLKIKEIKTELNSIENKKKKFQYAWVNEVLNYEDFKKRMEELNNLEKTLENDLMKLNANNSDRETLTEEEIKEVISDIKDNWNELNNSEKKQFLQSSVKSIDYTKEENCINISNITFINNI